MEQWVLEESSPPQHHSCGKKQRTFHTNGPFTKHWFLHQIKLAHIFIFKKVRYFCSFTVRVQLVITCLFALILSAQIFKSSLLFPFLHQAMCHLIVPEKMAVFRNTKMAHGLFLVCHLRLMYMSPNIWIKLVSKWRQNQGTFSTNGPKWSKNVKQKMVKNGQTCQTYVQKWHHFNHGWGHFVMHRPTLAAFISGEMKLMSSITCTGGTKQKKCKKQKNREMMRKT